MTTEQMQTTDKTEQLNEERKSILKNVEHELRTSPLVDAMRQLALLSNTHGIGFTSEQYTEWAEGKTEKAIRRDMVQRWYAIHTSWVAHARYMQDFQ